MVVVVDDEDRENEGDLTMAAEMVTPEAINFMATHGRGLICLAMTGERLDELELDSMAPRNTALHGTAFTVSIDAKTRGVTTGISAADRAQTILAAVDPSSRPDDFARPGHVFPLRAREGGVLERRGQTEAAVDLARLAGLNPAGVICEIVNDDGTMARVPDLIRFCERHDLLMISVADLVRYRSELGRCAAAGFCHVAARQRRNDSRVCGGRQMIYTHTVARALRYYPDQAAFASGEKRSTFRELHERVARVAASLVSHGFHRGDRLAMLLPNEPEYIELIYACSRLGVIAVPLNTRLSPTEIDRVLTDASPRGLIRHSSLPVPTVRLSWERVLDKEPLEAANGAALEADL